MSERDVLSELEAALEGATAGPWDPGDGTIFVRGGSHGALRDLELAVAAVNALPALIAVARAAEEHHRERTHGVTANVKWADEQLDAALAALHDKPPAPEPSPYYATHEGQGIGAGDAGGTGSE